MKRRKQEERQSIYLLGQSLSFSSMKLVATPPKKVMATMVAKSFLSKIINVPCSDRPFQTVILLCWGLQMAGVNQCAALLFWLLWR
jgi:hypothetical protein